MKSQQTSPAQGTQTNRQAARPAATQKKDSQNTVEKIRQDFDEMEDETAGPKKGTQDKADDDDLPGDEGVGEDGTAAGDEGL